MSKLLDRLPGLYDLLSFASNRMRPIIIESPTQETRIERGKPFEIKWFLHKKVVSMLEKNLNCAASALM